MTVVAFVLLLAIPVAMITKRTPFTAFLVAVWGFFLGMTPIGPGLAAMLNNLGGSLLGVLA